MVLAIDLSVLSHELGILDEVVTGGRLLRTVGREVGVELSLGRLNGVVRGAVLQAGLQGRLRVSRAKRISDKSEKTPRYYTCLGSHSWSQCCYPDYLRNLSYYDQIALLKEGYFCSDESAKFSN